MSVIADNLRDNVRRMSALAEDAAFVDSFDRAAALMVTSLRAGGTLFACGNGGSMTNAQHFAEELTGRFRGDRPPLRAIAISDPSHLTCVANDYGYEFVFSKFIEALARPGDVLLALTTSGKSANVLRAAEAMKSAGGVVIASSGPADTPVAAVADVALALGENRWADRIQESELVVIHSFMQAIEDAFGYSA
ncbi:MAG: SIS domain-containing protein [Microbacterium ginsengisoli]|uniref:D-sedoheptulose-7-phosphate isomerase n=1 Tax=Microbacterium TaxID=33882 RepID=UPI0006F24A55|nr:MULTISPECIES: SIS domain-containing protein [unclassified Microbacterium]MBN9198655.1 SIS domain-containing protein [Microbacterium ginsengisoli]KQR95925.1 phosphoheptose isomerase [Microbacterium sp. Leaf351]KQS02787.1 phosphoheptose isomerase [Microbacterium sp. Leaf347]ODU76439.1 MAG: phosphoheptose isomerase [Microbacterium sp. SCN 71-21]OJU75452.1 MAG: phosphoheptose isomerase [Microbacterium sp. 71-23]